MSTTNRTDAPQTPHATPATSNPSEARPATPGTAKGTPAVPLLGLRPREAAAAMGLSERLLWSMTNRGEIPHLHIGRAIIYPVDLLREWMREQAEKGARR